MFRLLSPRRIQVLALALLLPALALRALIPTGFMPGGSADSIIPLQMCSTTQRGTVQFLRIDRLSSLQTLQQDERAPLGHDQERHDPCEFGLLSHGIAPPPNQTSVVLAIFGREPRPQPVRDLAKTSPVALHAQQPRAPPRAS